MTRLFITTEIFDKMWEKLGLNDVDLLEVEKILIKNPKAGAVIPECQGVRKLRITLPGIGKRGGARVIYIDIVATEKIYFLMAYPKSKKDTTSEEDNKTLRQLANKFKK